MNLGPTPTVANPAPTSGEAANIRAALVAGHVIYNTTEDWIGVTLADGAIGIETDADPRKMKIGDGVTVWADLAYFGGSEDALLTTAQTLTDPEKTQVHANIGTTLEFAGSDPNANHLLTSFAGTDNDFILRSADTQLVIAATASAFPTSDWFSNTGAVVNVTVGSPGGGDVGSMTATELLAGIIQVPSPNLVFDEKEIAPGNDGSGNVVAGTYNFTPAPIATHPGQFCIASTAIWQDVNGVWIPRQLLDGTQITKGTDGYYSFVRDGDGAAQFTPFP